MPKVTIFSHCTNGVAIPEKTLNKKNRTSKTTEKRHILTPSSLTFASYLSIGGRHPATALTRMRMGKESTPIGWKRHAGTEVWA